MARLDFSKLADSSAGSRLLDPRDLFLSLNRPDDFEALRGPQDQVVGQWYPARNDDRDVVIKLNTGGGKTVVGLLLALSSLNDGAGPAAYLVPDKYLVSQVVKEATTLGIPVTENLSDWKFAHGEAIFVGTFDKLVNGRSVFGISGSVSKRAQHGLGTIVIDDAHACLARAEDKFTMRITRDEPQYDELLALFRDALAEQSEIGILDLEAGRHALLQVPHWDWSDKRKDVLAILHPLGADDDHGFTWPLIADALPLCRALVSSEAWEISPPCLPIQAVTGFTGAKRRIYLTATLADDGVLVTDFGADPDAVAMPIVPTNAGDIGDRMIFTLHRTHPHLSDDELIEFAIELAQERNVAVITASDASAVKWREHAKLVLDKNNIIAGVEQMRSNRKLGLVVFISRYDGIDLPGDACHVLILDGLPQAASSRELLDEALLSGGSTQRLRQIQRLEQGMGRAVRSNRDYCVVLLHGARLAQELSRPGAPEAFSPASREQMKLSYEMADMIDVGPQLRDLREILAQCLERDPDWVSASKKRLATVRYEPGHVSKVAVASRKAFDAAYAGEFQAAITALQPALDAAGTTDTHLRGYLLQQLAAYQHRVDPAKAQQTQVAAHRANRGLQRPPGIAYEPLSSKHQEQGAAASQYLQKTCRDAQAVALKIESLIEDLQWGPRTDACELALADLADVIGLAGQRPERETGSGPDVLWAAESSEFYIIEAKSKAKDDHPVYKKDAEQLSNAMDWFKGKYPKGKGIPVLMHPRAAFDKKAAIPSGCRVITTETHAKLIDALRQLAIALAANDTFRDPQATGRLLASLNLTTQQVLDSYTKRARQSN